MVFHLMNGATPLKPNNNPAACNKKPQISLGLFSFINYIKNCHYL